MAAGEAPLGAWMGPGTSHSGDLAFEGRVRVDGSFTGRLYTEDLLEVGPEGLVEGEIDVARAVIAGTVRGRMRVREHLVLEAGARLSGKLDAGRVELRAGARVDAEVRIAGEELP